MVRRRTIRTSKMRVADLSGGLLVKLDTTKIPTKYARDARNLRFSSGSAKTRPGSVRVAKIIRPSYARKFPGTTSDYIEAPVNNSCPLWTGLGPDFSISFIERPVSLTPFPGPGYAYLFYGGTSTQTSFRVASTDGLDRQVTFREAGGSSDLTAVIGSVDDTGGVPDDRRYYYLIRRRGRDLQTLMVGSASGPQSNTHTDFFSSSSVKLLAADEPLYLGGAVGATYGMNSIIDNVMIWNRWVEDLRRYYWAEYPLLEDPDLLLAWRMNVSGATEEKDDSLYENTGEITGTVAQVSGEAEPLVVGQFLGEVEIGQTLHRLAMAGGACYREAVR